VWGRQTHGHARTWQFSLAPVRGNYKHIGSCSAGAARGTHMVACWILRAHNTHTGVHTICKLPAHAVHRSPHAHKPALRHAHKSAIGVTLRSMSGTEYSVIARGRIARLRRQRGSSRLPLGIKPKTQPAAPLRRALRAVLGSTPDGALAYDPDALRVAHLPPTASVQRAACGPRVNNWQAVRVRRGGQGVDCAGW